MIEVSLNVGDGVRLIKQAKLYMCIQTHYGAGVRGHGSAPLSHSGNVVTRVGLHTHTYSADKIREVFTLQKLFSFFSAKHERVIACNVLEKLSSRQLTTSLGLNYWALTVN